MKRKLSSTGGEASDPYGSDEGGGGVGGQAQPSSSLGLEQSALHDEAGGFVLEPRLALALSMEPGAMIFRGMFYGTPRAPIAKCLATQLLEERERLSLLRSGEGTSSSTQLSDSYVRSLIDTNAAAIQALLDSAEAPPLPPPTTTSTVVGGDVGTVRGRVSDVAEQGVVDCDGGFVLAPDLARFLGMRPGQALRRSMFYGTPTSDIVLELVTQLSEVRQDLLRSQELERSWLASGGMGFDLEDTASLIETNGQLIQALMASVESPSFTALPAVVVENVGACGQQAMSATSGEVLLEEEEVGTAAVHGQEVTGVPEQSESGSDRNFALTPDLAIRLGMYPGQALCRGMFYGTTKSVLVLEMISQLSGTQQDLLRNQELERAGLIPGGTEDVVSLIETNEAILRALIRSIEEPEVVVVDSEGESAEELVERGTMKRGTKAKKKVRRIVVSDKISSDVMEGVRLHGEEMVRKLMEEKASRAIENQERRVTVSLMKKVERALAREDAEAAKELEKQRKKVAKELENQRKEAAKELDRQRKEAAKELGRMERLAMEEMAKREKAARLEMAELARRERLERAEARAREEEEERRALELEKLAKQEMLKERRKIKAEAEKRKLDKLNDRQRRKEEEEARKQERQEEKERKEAAERERRERIDSDKKRRLEERSKEGEVRLQKGEARVKLARLELTLREEKAMYSTSLRSEPAIDGLGMTSEEVELELHEAVERESQLGVELVQVGERIRELRRVVVADGSAQIVSLERGRDIALAKVRELEIKVEMVRIKSRRRQLSQELNRLRSLE
ncbi:hypothetical protein [Candidatus Ichthyocystis sparus]|uniref:hypothetical protein n=3 Tax=Candidatus Ichthyocystis sparus TaxID=1561004 RepID=UPI000B0B3349|nr:hypothetical protein [Candidatus Ichthyocystis sparus]